MRTSTRTVSETAQRHELPFLNHAQQFRLDIETDVAHFVEEDGAVVGGLEVALLRERTSPGEGALDVAEQSGLEQIRRQRRRC